MFAPLVSYKFMSVIAKGMTGNMYLLINYIQMILQKVQHFSWLFEYALYWCYKKYNKMLPILLMIKFSGHCQIVRSFLKP